MINRSKVEVDKNGFIWVDGIRIARYLPESRSLEFIEARTGSVHGDKRRRAVIKVTDLLKISPA